MNFLITIMSLNVVLHDSFIFRIKRRVNILWGSFTFYVTPKMAILTTPPLITIFFKSKNLSWSVKTLRTPPFSHLSYILCERSLCIKNKLCKKWFKLINMCIIIVNYKAANDAVEVNKMRKFHSHCIFFIMQLSENCYKLLHNVVCQPTLELFIEGVKVT